MRLPGVLYRKSTFENAAQVAQELQVTRSHNIPTLRPINWHFWLISATSLDFYFLGNMNYFSAFNDLLACIFKPIGQFRGFTSATQLWYLLSTVNFTHSPAAFISIELHKQLQPCTKNPGTAGRPRKHTHTHTHSGILTHIYAHFFPCSDSLQSSCIYHRWNWVEQWHDGKGVVWWAWWKVESSPR